MNFLLSLFLIRCMCFCVSLCVCALMFAALMYKNVLAVLYLTGLVIGMQRKECTRVFECCCKILYGFHVIYFFLEN